MINPKFNTGLVNASKYLNMTSTVFKKNQIPSAHLRCSAVVQCSGTVQWYSAVVQCSGAVQW